MGEARFGRYRLERLLGKGGMGQIWLARDPDGRRVALKLLPQELAADASYRIRFEREAELAAALRDPHLVTIHRHGEIDGRLYIDMEFVEGTDLAARLAAEGPMAVRVAVDILGQVAAALDTAHRAGLVHRDVKPANILVRPDGFTYLIDFGIAHRAGQTAVTATGLAIGTWAYMAPERFSGRSDARTDVYSLACVLYECLTGRRPYGNTDPAQQMRGHLLIDPPPAATLNPAIPRALDHVIARGMAKEPAERYPTAGEFAGAARAATGMPPEDFPPQPSSIPAGSQPAPTERLPDGPAPTRVEAPTPTRVETRKPNPGSAQPYPAPAARMPTPTAVMPEPGPTPTRVETRLDVAAGDYPPVPAVYQPNPYVRPPAPPPGRRWYPRRPPVGGQWGTVRWPSRGPAQVMPPHRPVPRRRRAPKRRRGGVLTKVIGALVVIFLAPFAFAAGCFALIATGTSGSDGSTAARPPVVAEESPGPGESSSGPAPAGTAVRDGKFEFAVTGVESGVDRVGLQSPRGTYLIVSLDVRNISDETKWFLPFGQKLVDSRSRAIDHDTTATAWQTLGHGQGYSFEVAPGGSATTQLVFDIPADATPNHLELHDFILSGGTSVYLW
ncbi:protein kinase [Nocardia sp. NPDC005366]|uniref:protein kinase domain-containing protein n=1 Tax=Nocardia sp. NPDC005366 TaxID=3156878 RepID=UPI0033AC22DD